MTRSDPADITVNVFSYKGAVNSEFSCGINYVKKLKAYNENNGQRKRCKRHFCRLLLPSSARLQLSLDLLRLVAMLLLQQTDFYIRAGNRQHRVR